MKATIIVSEKELSSFVQHEVDGRHRSPADVTDQARRFGAILVEVMRQQFPTIDFAQPVLRSDDDGTRVEVADTPAGWADADARELAGLFGDIQEEVLNGKHGEWYRTSQARQDAVPEQYQPRRLDLFERVTAQLSLMEELGPAYWLETECIGVSDETYDPDSGTFSVHFRSRHHATAAPRAGRIWLYEIKRVAGTFPGYCWAIGDEWDHDRPPAIDWSVSR